ncbi:hypothetical protein RRG08_039860 [Elysia crispata]|uniref:Uncharacterized protein n=1 Tax=Elysia crispata TaxID=231223 RepID=A0AAE0ZWF6_9GAST|nr:hypothetical protein RRG08_039860 [Elysia crispata]
MWESRCLNSEKCTNRESCINQLVRRVSGVKGSTTSGSSPRPDICQVPMALASSPFIIPLIRSKLKIYDRGTSLKPWGQEVKGSRDQDRGRHNNRYRPPIKEHPGCNTREPGTKEQYDGLPPTRSSKKKRHLLYGVKLLEGRGGGAVSATGLAIFAGSRQIVSLDAQCRQLDLELGLDFDSKRLFSKNLLTC